jgi:RNA polymerase sigma-70 factor (ECF subfamily)
MTDGARRERFEAAYRELYSRICGYALRGVHEPEDAAEVIAETLATLWRRFDRCPQDDEPGHVRRRHTGVMLATLA